MIGLVLCSLRLVLPNIPLQAPVCGSNWCDEDQSFYIGVRLLENFKAVLLEWLLPAGGRAPGAAVLGCGNPAVSI